jgi:radical SAM protein with 4Fe4S-binding SPASM domain
MLRLPAYVQFEITDLCNLRCQHCYRFDTNDMPVSLDLSDEGVDLLVKKLVEAQIYSLVVTGGEPLIRPEATLSAVRTAKEAGIRTSVNTNLLFLSKEVAKELKYYNVDSVLVSCPSSNPYIYRSITRLGNYELFREKLLLLLSFDISCLVNMVATVNNFQTIRKTAKDMADLGVKRFSVTPASLNVECPNREGLLNRSQILTVLEDLRWCEESLGLKVDMLEPLPKCFYPDWCWKKDYSFMKRFCQAGRMSATISNTGNVRPCSHNPKVYGNVFQEKMEDIWLKMDGYRKESIPSGCGQCPALSICNGACRMNALANTGFIDGLDPLIIGSIDLPKKSLVEISFQDDSILSFVGKLRWRKEGGGHYSISSKINGLNLMVVNEEFFRFVLWLEKSLPLKFLGAI